MRQNRSITEIRIRIICFTLIAAFWAAAAPAQFRLFLSPPDLSAWPEIRIPLKVLDNTSILQKVTADQFTVREDGEPMQPLQVTCLTDSLEQTVHFMFILDVSLSMAFKEGTHDYDNVDSVKWRKAKQVFVESFRKLRPIDLGALISFAATSRLQQDFTGNVSLLEDALAGLELRSGTAIYDAVIMGLTWCTADTGKTVIILLTDGSDQSSIGTVNDAIGAARAKGVSVYIIGFDVEAARVSEMALLSEETGGEFALAPSANDLSAIFDAIMRNLLKSDCILTYTTPDTCRSGETRTVDVHIDISGAHDEGRLRYDLDDFRSRLRLYPAVSDTVRDGGVLAVPLRADGEIRSGEAVQLELVARHDPTVLTFLDAVTGGAVFEGQSILAFEEAPGLVRITASAAVPARAVEAGAEDVILYLRYDIPEYFANRRTAVYLDVVTWRQNCETVSAGGGRDFVVNGCPALLRMGLDTTLVVSARDIYSIPVFLYDELDSEQELRFGFNCVFDASLVTYAGFSTAGSVSERSAVTVRETSPGFLEIESPFAYPARRSGPLIYLRFGTRNQTLSSRVSLIVQNAHMEQSCIPDLIFSGDCFFTDGWCEPVLERKHVIGFRSISPNPVVAGRCVGAIIEFNVRGTDRTRLELTNLEGVPVRVLVDEYLKAGVHTAVLPAGEVPAGAYLCTLREGLEHDTRKLVVLR